MPDEQNNYRVDQPDLRQTPLCKPHSESLTMCSSSMMRAHGNLHSRSAR